MTVNAEIYHRQMARALELARLGCGTARPNPMVGAVVLNAQREMVGEGFHATPGQPHAEMMALQQAGPQAQNGTMIVTLEPCNHTGRTGPCVQAILDARIKRVVYGMADPNPNVKGGGAEALCAAGVEVIGPEALDPALTHEIRDLNRVFVHYSRTGKPYVTLKLALTLDGKIATRNGESRWLTGPEARAEVHRLRAGADAILTTASTVIADDPSLTVRNLSPELKIRLEAQGFVPPLRVVLDRQNRLLREKPKAKVLTDTTIPTLHLPMGVQEALGVLTVKGLTHVWVEAGGQLAWAMLEQGLVDELVLFYAPVILGDTEAKSGFSGPFLAHLVDAQRWQLQQVQRFGQDVMLRYHRLSPLL